MGNGLSLTGTRTIVSLVKTSSRQTTSSTTRRLSKHLSSNVGFLFSRVVSLLTSMRRLLSFSRNRVPGAFTLRTARQAQTVGSGLTTCVSA